MGKLSQPWAIVDIETNGLSHSSGSIIEVAAIRIEDDAIVDEFSSLVDPGRPVPRFITELTGITNEQLRSAPSFVDIEAELRSILDGAVFVAHSVRFDYSFVKAEFRRIGREFSPRLLCSVRLSRALNPGIRGHGLSAIIERYNIEMEGRHRAGGDVHAVWSFIKKMKQMYPNDVIEAAIAAQLKRQALPPQLSDEVVNKLPDGPGVYTFEDEQGKPLYIGKSVNVRKRVLSHFSQDHAVVKELKLSQLVHSVSARSTAGELEALLLESQLVKEQSPVYNQQLRRIRQLTLARKTFNGDGYIAIRFDETAEIDPGEASTILGAYPNKSQAKARLEAAQKIFDLCPKLLGLESGKGACFLSQLGKCRGACTGKESSESYNSRLMIAFDTMRIRQWPYKGPILIRERSLEDGHEVGIVVDQWCIVAHLSKQEHSETVTEKLTRRFDVDIYRILRSFLADKKPNLSVTPLSTQQLDALLQPSYQL